MHIRIMARYSFKLHYHHLEVLIQLFHLFGQDHLPFHLQLVDQQHAKRYNNMMYHKTTQGISCSQNNQIFTCSSLTLGNIIIKCNNVMGPHTNKPIGNFIIYQDSTTCNGIQVSNFQPYGGSITFATNVATGLYPNSNSLQMIWDNIVLPIAFTVNPVIEVAMIANAQFTMSTSIKGYASATSIGLLQSITASSSTLVKAQLPLAIATKDTAIKLYMESLEVMGNTQPIVSSIDFKDNNDVLYYQLLFPSISVNSNPLTASLDIYSTEINIYTQYSFTLTITDALNSAGFVRFAISKSLLSTTVTCYCDQSLVTPTISDNYIDIGGCLTTTGSHVIVIQNVLNPPSIISTVQISYIQTMQNGYSVDKLTNFQYTTPAFTPGSLSVSYTRSGGELDVVGGQSYFSLTISPKNQIPSSGTLKMVIPSTIQFLQQTSQTCTSDLSECTINLVNDNTLIFKFTQAIAASEFTITSISIPIRNPYDTSLINSFQFTSFDAFGNTIDTISNIPGYSVNLRSSFDGAITIDSDSTFTNGLSLKAIFTVKIKTPQFYPVTFTILTGDLTINNNPVCTVAGSTMTSCTKMSQNQLDVILDGIGSLPATTLIITISTIRCKDTMAQSTDFEFSTKSTNGMMSYQKGPSVTNTQYGGISSPQLIVDTLYYGGNNAMYQFNFELTNPLASSDYSINILCPFSLPTNGITCKDTSNNKLQCNLQSSNILSITGPFDMNQLVFSIIVSGLPTPVNQQEARTFTIKTYRIIDNQSYLVDSSANGAFVFSVSCPTTNNCRTCNIIDSTNVSCLTCYSSSISAFSFMKQSTCVESCGDGYYQNETDRQCQQCSANCKKCSYQSQNLVCSTCFDGYKYQDATCVINCGETYYLQLPTDSSCSKCNSECLQCSVNSSYCSKCQPNIPLYDNKCYVAGCQKGYYQTTNTNNILICALCPITCISCITSELCTECQSGQYYLSGMCRPDCPAGYFISDDNYTCNQCLPGCDSCSDNKSCVKCKTGFLLKQSTCVSVCGDSFYSDSTKSTCLPCDSKCKSCELSDSTVLCNSCVGTYYFSNFVCLQSCPSNYYSVNNECLQCSTNCVTCTTSYNHCTSCQVQAEIPLYLDGQACVAKCSDLYYPDITTGKCLECPLNCTVCTSTANCTQCQIATTMHYLVDGACIAECPTNYQPNGLTCEQIPIIIPVEPSRYVPVPYLIISLFLAMSVIASKKYRNETFIPGALLGLTSILVWASWITLLQLISTYQNKYYFWILVAGLLSNYISNIVHFVLLKTQIHTDPDFVRWQAAALKNKIVNFIFITFSLITSFPSHKMIMSRYFGFTFFKAKMVDIKPLFYFNCLSGVSIILVYSPIIVSCSFIAYYETTFDSQIFISSIDSAIITILTIILLIWETQKADNFFEEFIQNHYLNESNPQIEKQEISGYFQNPFEQRSQAEQQMGIEENEDPKQVNQENDITKQQDHSQEQSCNLSKAGISVILSDKNSNHVFDESHRSDNFQTKVQINHNQKHTVFYRDQNNPQENPDAEPPQASPESDNFSSVKSEHNGQCSFAEQSQSPLKDISQIDDSEEPHENSQLSIFDEDKNRSPSRQSKALKLQLQQQNFDPPPEYNLIMTTNECLDNYNESQGNENNPQIINKKAISKQDLFKKDKSQASLKSERDENKQSQQQFQQQSEQGLIQKTEPESKRSSKQLAKSAQFVCEQTLQVQQSQSRKSIETNKAQQAFLTQQNSMQEQPLAPSFMQQKQIIEEEKSNSKPKVSNKSEGMFSKRKHTTIQSSEFSDIPIQNIDNCPSIHSNQFQPKRRNMDIQEPQYDQNQNEVVQQLQFQVEILDSQPQFETDEQKSNNIPVLMDSRAIEEPDPFDDQIVFQQVKPYKMKIENKQNRAKSENQVPQKKKESKKIDKHLENVFDSNDSIHTMSDQDWGEHQISPSDFNSLNQRFEDEQDHSLEMAYPAHSKTQQNSRSEFNKQAKVKPVDIEFENDNNDELSYSGQAQVDFSNNYQYKTKQLEKIYLQKLDQQKFKKKPQKNQPKDISDAYINDQVNVEDIDF